MPLGDFAVQRVTDKLVDANFCCYVAFFGEAVSDLDEALPQMVLEEKSPLRTI